MRRRKLLIAALGAVGLVVVCVVGIPWIRLAFTTVSTDDAYVNGHVTFVAPRVAGQILRVLVDNNYRVRKGDLLAQIDKEPFEIAVSQKKAAVDTANADLQAAIASTRGIEAEAEADAGSSAANAPNPIHAVSSTSLIRARPSGGPSRVATRR